MKKKMKVVMIILACIAAIAAVGYWMIGNPVIYMNNQRLANSIKSIDGKTVSLNAVVPFAWDALYTFEPYQSQEEIAEAIGFKSADIKENNVNEGMVHLLFVKGEEVVASILGYGGNLGYRIDFSSKEERKITFDQDAQFNITRVDGVTTLIYAG